MQTYSASASTLSGVLLLGGEPVIRHLSQMAVAIGNVCALLHHVTPSTPRVGQQGWLGEWVIQTSIRPFGSLRSIVSSLVAGDAAFAAEISQIYRQTIQMRVLFL